MAPAVVDVTCRLRSWSGTMSRYGVQNYRLRRPSKLSSLDRYLGGSEAAEAQQAYMRLQAAFAEPLALSRNSDRDRRPQRCSCDGAACECNRSSSVGQVRSDQHRNTMSGRHRAASPLDPAYRDRRENNPWLTDTGLLISWARPWPGTAWPTGRLPLSGSRPHSVSDNCAQEWQEAREYCRQLIPLGHSGLTGGYGDIENCARGFVTAECGGNPIDYGTARGRRRR